MAKPEHVKCMNCVFFKPKRDDHPDDEGWCYRNPPAADTFPLLNALGVIYWAVSNHHSDQDREENLNDIGADRHGYDTHPECFGDLSWCGEFRSEWSAP